MNSCVKQTVMKRLREERERALVADDFHLDEFWVEWDASPSPPPEPQEPFDIVKVFNDGLRRIYGP